MRQTAVFRVCSDWDRGRVAAFRRMAMFWLAAAAMLFDAMSSAQAAAKINAAGKLLERAGINRGVCAVLDDSRGLSLDLARSSELLVHVREPDGAAARELQQQADEAGFGIDRLAVETGPIDRLPYAANVVDLIVAPSQNAGAEPGPVSVEEILRALRPDGMAMIGLGTSPDADKQLRQQAGAAGARDVQVWNDTSGTWLVFSKPPLEGAADWSHWEHGPDNNPVSHDTVIKAPYMTQFLAEPYYIPIPSITTAAGGRTFLAVGHIAHHRREWPMLNRLIARNGYNGIVLWERQLPEGYLVHRSAFIATKDTFYMIDGNGCLLLNPQTGEEKGEIRIPGIDGEWKWMALSDGVLYILAGQQGPGTEIMKGDRAFGGWSWADLDRGYYRQPRIAWGFGDTLAAYDLKHKQLAWKHTESKPIDSRGMSIGEDRLFLYCPELHLRCLNLKTGKVLWTNAEQEVLELIEEPGKGLRSTPGFRTACMAVYTPDALVIQGQTRMNVVAVSTSDGYHLWTKKKITNNPNAIYVDGKIILGVGPGGSHVAIEPSTGNVLADLNFRKVACTRLTASSDSFFCRGEGMLRFDRDGNSVLVDGAIRPACNDGALPANGLLYLGPWQCDCNLSLIGSVARCSAGDFRFDYTASEEERLEPGEGATGSVEPFDVSERDWATYRGNIQRSAGTSVPVTETAALKWEYAPDRGGVPAVPTSAGGLVFVTGHDGAVRALDVETGSIRWQYRTPSPVKYPPTLADGRAYFGSGDGYAYCLEAATGRLLWRFRAAPIERHIPVYGSMTSTWPVNTGVLVRDGVAYFGAGIVDHDGTYLYALDAKSGKIVWQNHSSGHLNPELRKGVSVQGNITILGDRLLLAGGNQISPAPFDLQTGVCLADPKQEGRPQANHGHYVGVFRDQFSIAGGRVLFSAPENVATKGSFTVSTDTESLTLSYGGIPPAWDQNTFALVNFKHGSLTCCDTEKVAVRLEQGYPDEVKQSQQWTKNVAETLDKDGAVRWKKEYEESQDFEAVSLAVCPNAVLAVTKYQQRYRAQPQRQVVAYHIEDGRQLWRHEIDEEPLPGGLLVDRNGRVVVVMLSGRVLCLDAAQ